MKYIVGASIGGLFGLSMPFMMEVKEATGTDGTDSRQEESQLVEDEPAIPIENKLILPDDYCGSIKFESTDPKEQAKECLRRSMDAIPAI